MAASRISIRIEHNLGERLEAIVRATGKTESEIVREALDDYLLRKQAVPTCFDVFKEAGAIGCVKSGPTDVSTNPKHMRHFGRE